MTKTEFLQTLSFKEPTCYILRGLPGSGKSTLAMKIVSKDKNEDHWSFSHCSADKFWVQADGSYKFDASRVPENHHWCLRKFCSEVGAGYSKGIFVDNTNTCLWEFDAYAKIAIAFGLKVVLVSLCIGTEASNDRNIHEAPLATIQRMQENFSRSEASITRFVAKHKIEHFIIDAE